jgi:hypothetical protein
VPIDQCAEQAFGCRRGHPITIEHRVVLDQFAGQQAWLPGQPVEGGGDLVQAQAAVYRRASTGRILRIKGIEIKAQSPTGGAVANLGDRLSHAGFKATPRDFLEGKAAIIWHTTGNLTNIRTNAKFPFGVAMLPAGVRRGSPTGGGNFYMFKSASPAQREASLKFLKFVTCRNPILATCVSLLSTLTIVLCHLMK